MFLMRSLWCAIICLSSAMICEGCDFEDDRCLTNAADKIFTEKVSSDPIGVNLVVAKLPTLNYTLFNATLFELKYCHIGLLRVNEKNLTFELIIECTHIAVDTAYEVYGCLGPNFIEGKGSSCKHDYYDYNFLFHGNYKQYKKHGKCYVRITDHVLNIEAKGNVHYDCNGLYYGDKIKSDAILKFSNVHWCFVDKTIRRPFMEAFMNKVIDNGNDFLKVTPLDDIFPHYIGCCGCNYSRLIY